MFSTWGLEPSWCNTTLWAVAGRVLRNFLQILWFILPFPHPLPGFPSFLSCVLTSSFFFEKRDFLSFKFLRNNPWALQLLEAKVPMAEDFHTTADLLFARWLGVDASRGWSAVVGNHRRPKCGFAEVSRLRCEHDRKVAQGVIRRNQLVNSGWLCKTGNPCRLENTTHVRHCGLGTDFFTAGYSHNKRKFRCGKLLGRKHMFQVASNLLQPFC